MNIVEKRNCCGCFACKEICPIGCIEMRADEEGFLYPRVDRDLCVHCGLCEQVCPVLHGGNDASEKFPDGYAVIHGDDEIRLASSSGGAFSLLAESVIRDGGIVFGAAMSEDCRSVIHIGVNSLADLARLRGSKYVQSIIGDTYAQAREALDEGRKVLFTGTPCQIEGLYGFLRRKEYEKLVCMDFICHGVPSPEVWGRYVDFREKLSGAPARQIVFRHKNYGWKQFAVSFVYTNDTVYCQKHGDDLYMTAFLRDCCLRPSCYNCHFRKLNRISDFTVADYWGVQRQYPDMDDDRGTSLVLIHTEKGKSIFESVRQSARVISIDTAKALRGNRAMTESPPLHKTRKKFMAGLDQMSFDRLVRKYARKPLTVKSIIKWLLRRTKLETFARNIIGK